MITGINESTSLAKVMSWECKCKFDRKNCNSDQWWKKDKCRCDYKKPHVCKKEYVWTPSTCICENRKYLLEIIFNGKVLWMIQQLSVMKLESYRMKK